ncbi:hypothetical protein RCF27_08170 [Rhodococcus pyridinivorans]|uniref:hypothetical protein n=1 Tax=Rhodococcus pyridinivorans TaxID=103816 RepID=UPI00280A7969|nr:hypothetical protein [Rhodococcus pyridinivorans]WMM74253.1 hypothetical protein RCF27_08170 [Rhodococcus pyridinivorans]
MSPASNPEILAELRLLRGEMNQGFDRIEDRFVPIDLFKAELTATNMRVASLEMWHNKIVWLVISSVVIAVLSGIVTAAAL